MKKKLHEGSVKDIYKTGDQELTFKFSDRYSIFDWGKMPNEIPGKGKALSEMGAIFLEDLKKAGVNNHLLRRGDDPTEIIVKEVDVPRDRMWVYKASPTMTLIPIEFIYRFGVPKGSSLLRKFPQEMNWIQAGFDRQYKEGEFFNDVVIDFTTKLEPIDRELSKTAVIELAGINDQEMDELYGAIRKTAHFLRDRFKKVGLTLWDGKLEFAFDENRKILLVDSIGLDEMRVTFEGQSLSKEILRQFYLNSKWFSALNEAKKESPTLFRQYCERVLKQTPEPLSDEIVKAISSLYASVVKLLKAKSDEEIQMIHGNIRTAFSVLGVKS